MTRAELILDIDDYWKKKEKQQYKYEEKKINQIYLENKHLISIEELDWEDKYTLICKDCSHKIIDHNKKNAQIYIREGECPKCNKIKKEIKNDKS